MRDVNGYVCVARLAQEEKTNYYFQVLFGKNKGGGTASYENIVSNGIALYNSLRDAKKGMSDLFKRREFDRVQIRKLEMHIAEKDNELIQFKDEKSLVVVWKNDSGEAIIGRRPEGCPGIYPLYGALINYNGLIPYTEFQPADYSRSEAIRQAWSPATLAKFKISKPILSKTKKK